jgi:hypothetical protein
MELRRTPLPLYVSYRYIFWMTPKKGLGMVLSIEVAEIAKHFKLLINLIVRVRSSSPSKPEYNMWAVCMSIRPAGDYTSKAALLVFHFL